MVRPSGRVGLSRDRLYRTKWGYASLIQLRAWPFPLCICELSTFE